MINRKRFIRLIIIILPIAFHALALTHNTPIVIIEWQLPIFRTFHLDSNALRDEQFKKSKFYKKYCTCGRIKVILVNYFSFIWVRYFYNTSIAKLSSLLRLRLFYRNLLNVKYYVFEHLWHMFFFTIVTFFDINYVHLMV